MERYLIHCIKYFITKLIFNARFGYQITTSIFVIRYSIFVLWPFFILLSKRCFGTDYQVFNNKAYFYMFKLKLNAFFSSADVQPPVNLIQLPLIIGLPCETYSRVSLWKLLLSPFRAAYFEKSRSGNSKIEQTPPIRIHIDAHGWRWANGGRILCSEKIWRSVRDSNPGPLDPQS